MVLNGQRFIRKKLLLLPLPPPLLSPFLLFLTDDFAKMSSSSSSSLQAAATAARKRDELAGLQEMRELSMDLVDFLGDISERFETLSKGSAAVADTVGRWSDVFQLMAAHEKEKKSGRGLVIVPPHNNAQ